MAAALLPCDDYCLYKKSTGKSGLADLVPKFLVLVSMPEQGPVRMIQILKSRKLLQAARKGFSSLLVAFPKLFAPNLLQWCNPSDT